MGEGIKDIRSEFLRDLAHGCLLSRFSITVSYEASFIRIKTNAQILRILDNIGNFYLMLYTDGNNLILLSNFESITLKLNIVEFLP